MFELIYVMRSKTTECFYIGSTKNLKQRIQNHLSSFRKNKHARRLQAIYDVYGENDWEWFVLETVPEGVEAKDYEPQVIERYWGDPLLLNKTKSGSPGIRNKTIGPQSAEHRQKLGNTFRGKPKSQEQKAKMSEAKRLWWERKRNAGIIWLEKFKKAQEDLAFCYGS